MIANDSSGDDTYLILEIFYNEFCYRFGGMISTYWVEGERVGGGKRGKRQFFRDPTEPDTEC